MLSCSNNFFMIWTRVFLHSLFLFQNEICLPFMTHDIKFDKNRDHVKLFKYFFHEMNQSFTSLSFFFRTRPAFLLWPTTSLTTSCTRVTAPVSRVWSAVVWLWMRPNTPWSTTTPAVSPRSPRDTPTSPTLSVWSYRVK